MIIEFPEYLPDLPDFNNPGTTVANNVLPSGDSYNEFQGFTASVGVTLSSYVRGGILVRDPSTGQSINFVGNQTKLLKGTSTSWNDVSVAGGYALSTDSLWFFTQFNTRIVAVCADVAIQSYDLASSSLFSTLVATIKARYVATVKDFVMVANTFDSVDGNVPNRVRWCALGDPTDWAVSAVTQADYQNLDAEYGWITGLVGGDYAVVFQERAITRLDYVGSPLVFQFNTVEQNQGTIYPKSIVRVGTLIYYRGIDGFYVFDGSRSISIGANKVDDYFIDNLDQGYPDRISTAVDYQKQLIYWAFPVAGNVAGNPNKLLIYNYSPNATKRWTTADVSISFLMNVYTYGYTIDNIDGSPPGFFVTNGIDSVGAPSLDSRVFTGQNLTIGVFDGNNVFGTFEGTTQTATITTAEYEINEAARTELHRFKPVIVGSFNSALVTARVGYREQVNDNITYTSALTLNSFNEFVTRVNSRYFRFEISISSGAWDAVGFQILESKKVGTR